MKKLIFLVSLIFLATKSYAVSDSYTAQIKNLRVESNYGLITMEGVLPWAESLGCSDTRVWLDLRDDIDKIKYSTALAALMAEKKVFIRAVDTPNNLVYGTCKLYDILVYR